MDNAYKTFIIHWHTTATRERFHSSYSALRGGYTVVTAKNKNDARRAIRSGLALYPGEALKIDRVEAR